jgi:hypothetical protein
MYNLIEIDRELERLSPEMGGVFTRTDLLVLLDISEDSSSKFDRILAQLIKNKILYRFCRGFYVRDNFDLAVLSQKIDPESYISFTNVLGNACVVGQVAGNSIIAVSPRSRPRNFSCSLGRIKYVTIDSKLMDFGIEQKGNLWVAEKERAFLDVLYFYKKGMKFNFNIYSDVNIDQINIEKVLTYLKKYKNPNFVGFVRSVINENRKV